MKTTNIFLALDLMAAIVFASCSKSANPTQQNIETKMVGKWKSVCDF